MPIFVCEYSVQVQSGFAKSIFSNGIIFNVMYNIHLVRYHVTELYGVFRIAPVPGFWRNLFDLLFPDIEFVLHM